MIREILASLVFGTALAVLGGFLLRWHLTVWRGQQGDGSLDDRERRHFRAQFRRRAQVSLLLILLGVMIPLSDYLMTARQLTRAGAALLILAMLIVALWIMLLASLDWLSMRVRRRATRVALASLARQRRELEEEVARLRQHRQNGRGS